MTETEKPKKPKKEKAPVERVAFSPDEIAASCGIGLQGVYDAMNARELACKKYGKRTLITRAALEAWLEGLPDRITPAAA